MKNLILFVLTVFIVSGLAPADSYAGRKIADPIATGDDVFPWPWGSECPFPWKDIEGAWVVRSLNKGAYEGTYLDFEVQEESAGVKYLRITQYDRLGYLIAEGKGYSEKDKRIVRALLRNIETGKSNVLMVRTYVREKGSKRCSQDDLVTAVTFCPVRGKKCLETENYVLQRE